METNATPMTIKDVLTDIRNQLNEIKIPVSQIENIGIPVARAINGIQLCIDTFQQAESGQGQEPKEDEPEIELVEVTDKEAAGEQDA